MTGIWRCRWSMRGGVDDPWELLVVVLLRCCTDPFVVLGVISDMYMTEPERPSGLIKMKEGEREKGRELWRRRRKGIEI